MTALSMIANGIRHTGKQSETVPTTITETKPVVSTEDIPATGVDTPYFAVIILMLFSILGLLICRFRYYNVLYSN